MSHVEAEIVELADRIVRSGYSTSDEAVSEIVEVMGYDGTSANLRQRAREAVERALVAHDHEERLWGTTDNDRLERAAVALEANGILVRQNFSCCQACGFDRIPTEVESAATNGQTVRGVIFSHWNDTERAIDGRGLGLSYAAIGAYSPAQYPLAAQTVAAELVEALRREGLSVRWSGSLDQRVTVSVRWQRRRFTAPPH